MGNKAKARKLEARPCPFCGSRVKTFRDGTFGQENGGWYAECSRERQCPVIMATVGPYPTLGEALDAWNHRPGEEAVAA